MERENAEESLKERIQSGKIQREDVAKRLAELAFGKPNDCVRLVLEADPTLEELDLSLLSAVKRNGKGAVEVRLIDRLRVLEQLSQMMEEGDEDLATFLKALQDNEAAQ